MPAPPGNRQATFLAALASLAVLAVADVVVVPLLVAVLVSICLGPGVTLLCRLRVPRSLAAAVVLVVPVITVAALFSLLAGPLVAVAEALPRLLAGLRRELRVAGAQDDANPVVTALGWAADDLTEGAVMVGVSVALTYFLLVWGGGVGRAALAAIRRRGARGVALRVCSAIRSEVTVYLTTISLINLCFGVAAGLLLLFLGVPHALQLGALAALLNFMPFIGAFLMISLLAMLGVDARGFQWAALVAPAAFFLLHLLEAQFITPQMLGRRLVLNPLVVVLAVLLGGTLWGLGGAFLAVPILTTLKVSADVMPKWRRWGQVLGRGASAAAEINPPLPSATRAAAAAAAAMAAAPGPPSDPASAANRPALPARRPRRREVLFE
jgi:predicted PurR-regulated permease PerM